MKIVALLIVFSVIGTRVFSQHFKQVNGKYVLTTEGAAHLAALPLKCIQQQFPYKTGVVFTDSSLIRNPKSEWREWIDLEHDICYGPDNHWSALTDGRTKYIFHARDGEEQLFDLTSDPAEMNDLAQDTSHSQSLRLWRQKLIDYLSERGDRFVKGGKLALRPESYLYSPNYPACSCHPRQRSA